MSGALPTQFAPRPDDPARSDLSEEDAFELALLRIPDDAWKRFLIAHQLEATGTSGIPSVEAFFARRAAREAKEQAEAAKAAEAAAKTRALAPRPRTPPRAPYPR